MDWLELITFAIGTFIRVLKSFALAAGRLALYFIRLAAYPVAGIWGTFLFVFSPVIHTVRLVLSPVLWLLNSFPRLQPLYIYFGSAAFTGLVVGLVFKLTSTSMLTILNLYDDPNDAAPSSTHNKPNHPPYSHSFSPDKKTTTAAAGDDYGYGFEDQDAFSRPTTPHSQFHAEQRKLEMLLANLSSPDLHLDRGRGGGRGPARAALAGPISSGSGGGWRDSPNIKRKRRSVSGGPLGLGGGGLSSSSRFHTILEEEDDSL